MYSIFRIASLIFLLTVAAVPGCGGDKSKSDSKVSEPQSPEVLNFAMEGKSGEINSIAISGSGMDRYLWLGTKAGLYRASLSGGGPEETEDFQLINVRPVEGREIKSVIGFKDSSILVGSEMGVTRISASGSATYDAGQVISLFQHPRDESIWAGTLGEGAVKQPSGASISNAWTRMSSETLNQWKHPELSRDVDRIYSFGFDGRDTWVGTGDGLLVSRGSGWQLFFGEHRRMSMSGTIQVTPGNSILPGNRVTSLAWDGDKTLYAGVGGGVAEISQGSGITRVYTADKRVNETVDNRMQTVVIPGNSPLAGAWVKALQVDKHGRLWIATTSGVSVKNGENWVKLGFRDGFMGERCHALLVDDDIAWIGTDVGLIRVKMALDWRGR